MKYLVLLVALIGHASAQAATCTTDTECVDAFGSGVETCCGQLKMAELPNVENPNYGGFAQYIWRIPETAPAAVAGHTVTLCLPKAYIKRHAEDRDDDGRISAWDNLQDVLDTVPNVDVAYGITGVTKVEDWVSAYGADVNTIKGLQEEAKCVTGKWDSYFDDDFAVYAAVLAVSTLFV